VPPGWACRAAAAIAWRRGLFGAAEPERGVAQPPGLMHPRRHHQLIADRGYVVGAVAGVRQQRAGATVPRGRCQPPIADPVIPVAGLASAVAQPPAAVDVLRQRLGRHGFATGRHRGRRSWFRCRPAAPSAADRRPVGRSPHPGAVAVIAWCTSRGRSPASRASCHPIRRLAAHRIGSPSR